MAKASFQLSNGTKVSIEGSPEEVEQILSFYSGKEPAAESGKSTQKPIERATKGRKISETGVRSTPDISEVVNLVKNCDESEAIEKQILDRTSFVDRTLLPLYIVHQYLDNSFGLTSGDINKITVDLGIPISTANISTTLSGSASRYVVGDKIRRSGVPVRYKLSRRGLQYIKSVISGHDDDK